MKGGMMVCGSILLLIAIGSLFVCAVSAETIIIDTEKGEPRFWTEPARDLPANWRYVQDHPDSSADGWFDTNAYPPGRGNCSFWYTISFPDMGECKGIWETSLPHSGKYEVFVWIPCPDTFDPYLDKSTPPSDYLPTKRAQYKVFHNGGVATVSIDQNENKGGFTSLGVFDFNTTARVELSSNGVEFWRCVAFDAVTFVPVVHDMAVTDVSIIPPLTSVEQSTAIYVTVTNKGTRQEDNVSVKVYVDDAQVGSTQYMSLAKCSSDTATFLWTPNTVKTYSIRGEVGIASGERDEDDNTMTTEVSVSPAPTPLPVTTPTRSTSAVTKPIELTYTFADPIVGKIVIGEHEYDTLSIPSCDLYGAPGEPVLPLKSAYILIPYGEEVHNIQVIPGTEVYVGEFYIQPGQEQVPLSFEGPFQPTPPNETIYNLTEIFPKEVYSEVSVQGLCGYKLLILNLNPVKYIPKERKLSYFESMNVTVTTAGALSHEELYRGLPEDRARVTKMIDNPDELSSYDSAEPSHPEHSQLEPTSPFEYVIITNEELLGAPGPYNFQALRDSKIAKGMTAAIVTTEWIYDSYGGVDNQTKIRNFIIDAYLSWNARYVLLGGDGDGADVGGESGDDIIPARGFWTGLTSCECDPPNIPADMYYSCLNGTFDYNLNGIYGEPWDGPGGGEVDLFAEVYVGRAPVDSSTEVSNFVKKTLAYESAAFLPKALMAGEYLGWTPWGGDYKDEVKEGAANWGYTTVGFPQPPFAVDKLYDRDYPGNDWPKLELINRLNNDPNIVNHLGHANPTSVMRLYNSDVEALTNSKYFFGWTQGCYAGSFDNRWFEPSCNYGSSDCILEHFVVDDHGAFAFIGNSRYGWGNLFNTNGPSQRFDREFWDAVFGGGITRIGVANADSKEDNAGLIGDEFIRFCYYELNLFGDPATSLIVTTPVPPEITSFAPPSPVNDKVCNWRAFNVTIDQTVNVGWYLNGSLLFTNETVREAGCMLHANATGQHIVSAIAANQNGMDVQNWAWNVAPKLNCTCGDICVNTSGWWRDDGVFNPSNTPIQDAIDNASAGNIICVMNGTYFENVVVNKSVTLKGIDNPVVDANGSGSVIILSADRITLEGFNVTNSGDFAGDAGIKVLSCSNSISGNTAINNYLDIFLYYSSNNTVTDNNVSVEGYSPLLNSSINNRYDIYNSSSNDTIIQLPTFPPLIHHPPTHPPSLPLLNGNGYGIGIFLYSSSINNISGNTVSNNGWYGIYLSFSGNNDISDNTLNDNNDDGIRLTYSSNNILTNNTFENNGLFVDSSYHNTVEDNTVNDEPLVYLEDADDVEVINAGQVILVNCTNITVGNLDLSNTSVGIELWQTENSRIKNNKMNNNNDDGIELMDSTNNVISGNNVFDNSDNGILLGFSSSNIIYLNNIRNNTDNAYTFGSANIWNSTETLTYTYNGTIFKNNMGNYWDDYAGTDANNDGIGDTPYVINGDQDDYPLMQQWENYFAHPNITSFVPQSPVNDTEGATRTFNITINQIVNVSWQINGTEVHTDKNVTESTYTNTSAANGTWNVSAIVNNVNGTDMQTWVWRVEPSPCFIATAAYGTSLHEDINVLRKFRDEYMMPNPAGQALVKIYYTTSPPIADLIRTNEGLRTTVRDGLVKPLVEVTRRLVE